MTDRTAAEESRRFLATILETSEDGIIAFNPAGKILMWNHGAEAIFGYPADEAIGKHSSEFVPPEWHSNLAPVNEQTLQGKTFPNWRA